jgi:hypothetical protein
MGHRVWYTETRIYGKKLNDFLYFQARARLGLRRTVGPGIGLIERLL